MGQGIKISAVIVAVCLLAATLLVGCNSNDPASVLPRIESAFNNQDVDGLIDVIDPTYANIIHSARALFGMVADSDEIPIELMPLINTLTGQHGDIDGRNWGTIQLTEIETTDRGNNRATVRFEVLYTTPGGAQFVFDDFLRVKEVDGTWYIQVL